MHFSIKKSNTFELNLKWEIGLWNKLKNQKECEFKEHFFVFKFMLPDSKEGKEQFLVKVEFSPSDLAVIKSVNCKWNCNIKTSNSDEEPVTAENESTSNFEQLSPITIIHGCLNNLNENSILTFEFTSTYQFITLTNTGLPNIDYSNQMLKSNDIKPDCNIIVGNKILKVHTFMLTAGSDIFERIIRLSENRNRIDIVDFDPFVVKDAIKFIYGQKPLQAYFQLYRFSTLYRIRQLMEFCEFYFEKNLGPNNVIPIYQTAFENDRGYLRHFCVVFYKNNKESVEKEETYLNASDELKKSLLIPFVLGP